MPELAIDLIWKRNSEELHQRISDAEAVASRKTMSHSENRRVSAILYLLFRYIDVV